MDGSDDATRPRLFRLYQRLGCTEHHRYQYWVPG